MISERSFSLPMDYVVHGTEAGLLIVLRGRLDTDCCSRMADPLLLEIRDADPPVIFDLADVSFVASAFLRICLQTTQLLGSGNLHLRHPDPNIRKVFKIAGLDGLIHLE
jgi:anti-anti-sigma factor